MLEAGFISLLATSLVLEIFAEHSWSTKHVNRCKGLHPARTARFSSFLGVSPIARISAATKSEVHFVVKLIQLFITDGTFVSNIHFIPWLWQVSFALPRLSQGSSDSDEQQQYNQQQEHFVARHLLPPSCFFNERMI